MNGSDLLTQFRESRSERAFAELVSRYSNLVYSIAKRRLGDSTSAEDVTQTVFARLAQAAPKLATDAELLAWLHRTTVHVAIDSWRSESRRRTREQQAAVMEPFHHDPSLWNELCPILDEALDSLNGSDRQALLARFFDGKSMREVGLNLRISEPAAKMRVGRAIERLRQRLSRSGISCSTPILCTLLAEHAIEAAPSQIATTLAQLRFPELSGPLTPVGFVAFGRRLSRFQLVSGTAILLVVSVSLVGFLNSSRNQPVETTAATPQPAADRPPADTGLEPRLSMGQLAGSTTIQEAKPKLLLRVLASDTGVGLARASVRAAYFGLGGSGEAQDLLADDTGLVAIPHPRDPSKNKGMNVFVAAENHVPKAFKLGEIGAPDEYTIRLDPAISLGGTVVNAQGLPVPRVTIRVQGPGNKSDAKENIDFQTSAVMTDADGRWLCSYIPKDFEEVRFILTHDHYAVTLPVVPIGKFDLMKLQLVIAPGFVVSGTVTDSQGRPIPAARIRELNNSGYRRQSTATDETGAFVFTGMAQYDSYQGQHPEAHSDGSTVIRGIVGLGQPFVDLVVQAEGFAPQTRRIPLVQPTNLADFSLQPGKVLRGRVIDQNGDPVRNAVVRTDTDNQGLRKFEWFDHTDAEGRFEWNSAPEDPVLLWFEADGYEWKRDLLLTPDGTEHQVTLKAGPKN